MKRTRISELLGIAYPILQGGMFWLAEAGLASTVSNAGGLGIISPYAGMEIGQEPAEQFRLQVRRMRQLTQKPWGVNLLLDLDETGILVNEILQERPSIVITAAGSPHHYTDLFHAWGMKVFHVISSVRQARYAESCHVDAVIAEGVEAAAHIGFDEIPLFSLIPQVADAVTIPVVAAGGIADARGVVAAMALGAEGVQLGTRFVAVDENIAHPQYKQAILSAQDNDTVVTCRRLVPTRVLRTEFSDALLRLEMSGASAEALRAYIGRGRDRDRRGQIEGDLIGGTVSCGTSAGLIREIISAADVIRNFVAGYAEIVRTLD